MGKIAKIFGGSKAPDPAPLPPVPTRADPEIEAARKRQQASEKLRKGRKTVLTSGQGVTDAPLSVSRPEAGGGTTRQAKLLGE